MDTFNQECLDLSEEVITKMNWITPPIDDNLDLDNTNHNSK